MLSFLRRSASGVALPGVAVGPPAPAEAAQLRFASEEEAEEAEGRLQAFDASGRPLGASFGAASPRGTARGGDGDAVLRRLVGEGGSLRAGLALPPAEHAFWREADAPQQALSALAACDRERCAGAVAQRALGSAAEFLTKKNARLKADLADARAQLALLAAQTPPHAAGAEAPQDLERERERERARERDALEAAQAEARALRRRAEQLDDALAASERQRKALKAAVSAGTASGASGGASSPSPFEQAPPFRPPSRGASRGRASPSPPTEEPPAGALAAAQARVEELEGRLADAAALARSGADAADAAIAQERARATAALAALSQQQQQSSGDQAQPELLLQLQAQCAVLRAEAAQERSRATDLARRLRGGDVAQRAASAAAALEAERGTRRQIDALRADLAAARASGDGGIGGGGGGGAELSFAREELARAQEELAVVRGGWESFRAGAAEREAALQAASDASSRRAAAAEGALTRERAAAGSAVEVEREARRTAEAALSRASAAAAALSGPSAASVAALRQRLAAAEAALEAVSCERDGALAELSRAGLADVERLQAQIDDELAMARDCDTLRGQLGALAGQLRAAQAVASEASARADAAEAAAAAADAAAEADAQPCGDAAELSAAQAQAAGAVEEARGVRAALELERSRARDT